MNEQGKGISLRTSRKECSYGNTLIFLPLRLILNLKPLELEDNKFVVFSLLSLW